ncbi:hypothetical protein ACFL1X_01230 [Candidatus Hydrogenedentota bacterium]
MKATSEGSRLSTSTLATSAIAWGQAVSSVGDGSYIVTGLYEGQIVFQGGEDQDRTLTSDSRTFFLAGYDSAENFVWAKQGEGESTSEGLDAISDGSSFVVGSFAGEMVLGRGEGHEALLESNGLWTHPHTPNQEADAFLAKFSPDGSLLWAKSFGGPNVDKATVVEAQDEGGCIVTAEIEKSAVLGGSETSKTTIQGPAGVVASYTADGALRWAHKLEVRTIRDIAVFADGSFVITGTFSGTATFGKGEEHETVLVASGDDDLYIAKFSSEGNLLWAKGEGSDYVSSPSFCPLGYSVSSSGKRVQNLRDGRWSRFSAANFLFRGYYGLTLIQNSIRQ